MMSNNKVSITMKSLKIFIPILLFCVAASISAQNVNLKLTDPVKNARYDVCSDIRLAAEVTVQTGSVKNVEFYINGKKFKTITKSPYEIMWPAVPDGMYELYAKASDTLGESVATEPILITVGAEKPGNVIINGEFNCALSPWFLDNYVNAVSTCTIVPDLLLTDDSSGVVIEIQNQGDQFWAVQLMQPFKVKAGHTYEATFTAQADEAKNIYLDISKNYDDYSPLFSFNIDVEELDTYGPFTFEPTADDENLMFKFVLGGNTISFYLDAVVVIDKQWTTAEHAAASTELDFKLHQNYPNPFNPQTTISYTLEKSGLAELTIFDTLGRRVTDYSAFQPSGDHGYTWDGRDALGRMCASGLYIYQLRTDQGNQVKKMHLLR
ncbi:MAG: T9SS C-terminal target domain-containing protein [Calditrichaeota bacterium]|nr:MAG: T9SS C-terminal target domain-containing protein [Calditrichota bacterium]